MSQTTFIRSAVATGAVVAGLAAGALAVPMAEVAIGTAPPARAGGPSTRVARSSPTNAEPVKAARVVCPDGMVPYSGGGAVDYGPAGGTGAALTSILPDLSERAVIVTAEAPPSQTGEWSLVAFAICSTSSEPALVVRHGLGAASATCPDGTFVFGTGFRVDADPAAGHVAGIAMNPGLTRVQVTAGGPDAATTEVTAIAVCRAPGSDQRLVSARNDSPGWPKTAYGQENDSILSPYAVGAAVTGPEAATLDAVVPGTDDGVTWARGALFGATPGAARAAADGNDGDDGSVTVEAGLIGTFH